MKSSLFAYSIFLKELSNKDRTNMSTLDKERQDFLHSHADCFSEGLPGELPPVRPEDHTIDLIPGSTPPNPPPYRVSRAQNEEITNQVKDLLEKGLIQPSSSPYCSPMLLVLKKDGSWRMCIDYRALNKITIKNKFQIPRIDDILDRLQGSSCFSRIDLKSGYHQIRIEPGDVYKTAFRTTFGLFKFLVMPFGLTNAPATFNRMMDKILREYRLFVGTFFDEIIVFFKNEAEHRDHLLQMYSKDEEMDSDSAIEGHILLVQSADSRPSSNRDADADADGDATIISAFLGSLVAEYHAADNPVAISAANIVAVAPAEGALAAATIAVTPADDGLAAHDAAATPETVGADPGTLARRPVTTPIGTLAANLDPPKLQPTSIVSPAAADYAHTAHLDNLLQIALALHRARAWPLAGLYQSARDVSSSEDYPVVPCTTPAGLRAWATHPAAPVVNPVQARRPVAETPNSGAHLPSSSIKATAIKTAADGGATHTPCFTSPAAMYQQPIMAEESLIIEVFLAAINAEDSTPAAQPVAAGFPYAADITLSTSSTTAADADRAPTPVPSIGEHSRPTAPLQDNLAALPLIFPATEDEIISTFLGLLLPADDTHPAEEYHQHYSSPSGVLSPARHVFAASPSMQGIPHAATTNNPAHGAFAAQGISLTPLGHHYLPADEVLAADVAAVLITNHHAAMPPACDTFTANLCPHCLRCPHRFGSPPRHGRPLTSHRRHDGPAYLVLPLTGYRAAHRPQQFPPSALYFSKLDIPTAYIYVPLPLAHHFPTSLLFGDPFHAGTPHHFAAATPFSSTDAILAGANHLSELAHGASPFAAAPSATKHPLLLWMPISFDPGGQASNPQDANNALQVISQGQWLIRSTPMFVFKWFPGFNPRGPKPTRVPVWIEFSELPVEFLPWLTNIENLVGKVMGQKNRGDINPKWDPQVLVEIDTSQSLVTEVPIRDSLGHLLHLQKVVYRNLPNACFSCMKQGHLIKDCPESKSHSPDVTKGNKTPKTDAQGFQAVNRKNWSKNKKYNKLTSNKYQNRFQPLLTKIFDPYPYYYVHPEDQVEEHEGTFEHTQQNPEPWECFPT
ncbi:hypothetical protein L7F22_017656 [Adiantum nelumboides]|nr:hypothetical protein [Adiantum nelumboides]